MKATPERRACALDYPQSRRYQSKASGLELARNHLQLIEAWSYDFDGNALNRRVVEIDLPFWVFKRLKKLRVTEHDRAGTARSTCLTARRTIATAIRLHVAADSATMSGIITLPRGQLMMSTPPIAINPFGREAELR